MPKWLANWLARHRHPFNFALHMIGIPMTVVALPYFFVGSWLLGAILFMGGYIVQFIGHAMEGNDAGEVVLVKKALGLPYVAVVERPGQNRKQ
jgi:uncharacterized membrane protein YGL010W